LGKVPVRRARGPAGLCVVGRVPVGGGGGPSREILVGKMRVPVSMVDCSGTLFWSDRRNAVPANHCMRYIFACMH